MGLNDVVSEVYESFLQNTESARVVLIHARSRFRTALLSRILSGSDIRVFYYAMGADDVDVWTFLAGLTHDIAEQMPTFGTRVSQVMMDSPADLKHLVEALGRDLAELSDEPFLLLLDEFDRADIMDELQQFIEALIGVLPPQCRLVLSGRGMPRLAWMSLIAQNKAVILRDEELITRDFYDGQTSGDVRLHISALSQGRVSLEGEWVDNWEGHLPRLLFFFVLERPFVTRSEICQAFWPDLHPDQAVNVFHVTKRRLHKALDGLGVDVLVHNGGYYRVNPALQFQYDIVEFVNALIEGRRAEDVEDRLAAWEQAITLHQHPFLLGHNELWIARRRREYLAGFLEALTGIAEVRLAAGHPEQALTYFQRAVEQDGFRQDLHRRIMTIYADMDRRSEVASHYQRLRDELQAAGVAVDVETSRLYDVLMKGS